jgi:glutaminyl-tRNA synthetase
VHLYDHLFTEENPEQGKEGKDFKSVLNPSSLEILSSCRVEPSLAEAMPGTHYQFLRQGYFCIDSKNSSPETLVFNRTTTLRDTWAKIQRAKNKAGKK